MKLEVPKLDGRRVVEEILGFIRSTLRDAHAGGVVVGLSGGVDSSLTAALCVNALGKDSVLGVLMPTSFTPTQDVQDAQELALLLGIQTEYVSIDPICESFFSSLRVDRGSPSAKMPMANIRARARMVVLYYYANLRNYLVAGTSDRSEALIGFFTKYGDGGADFLPIVHLYKTQVRDVARFLGVPEKICKKPSSPQLYPGHKATDEIPVDYDKLDLILVGLFDERLPPHDVGRLAGVPIEVVNETLRRFRSSRHKRAFPPSLARGEYLSASI